MELIELVLTVVATLAVERCATTIRWRNVARHVRALLLECRRHCAIWLQNLAAKVDVPLQSDEAPAATVALGPLVGLPQELIHSVLSHCDAQSLASLDCTCRSFHCTTPGAVASPIELAVREIENRDYSDAAGFMRLKQSAPARLRWLQEAECADRSRSRDCVSFTSTHTQLTSSSPLRLHRRQASLWARERERRPSGTTLWPRCPAVTQVGSFVVAVLHFALKQRCEQSMHRAALSMLESMAEEAARAEPVLDPEVPRPLSWLSEEIVIARETGPDGERLLKLMRKLAVLQVPAM